MLIKDLPEDIKKRALRYQYESLHKNDENDELCDAFNWSDTIEGTVYWSNINNQTKSRLYTESEMKANAIAAIQYYDNYYGNDGKLIPDEELYDKFVAEKLKK